MPKLVKTIKNRFNSQTPKIKQIFCKHKFEWGREYKDKSSTHSFCIYLKCKKCGYFKEIDYFEGE